MGKTPSVEVQAIIALCHHSPMDEECNACIFRTQAATEHLAVTIAACIKSLGGAD